MCIRDRYKFLPQHPDWDKLRKELNKDE